MRHAIHVCLVSDQATPNLTPTLDPGLRPEAVILVVSPAMKQRADWLEEALRPAGLRVERHAVRDPYDVEKLHDDLLALALAHPTDDLALNATCGTKPMSIAAYEVFRDLERPVFYVDPERDRLVWLYHPGATRPPPVDLADRVRLPAFLGAHGIRVVGGAALDGLPAVQRALCDELVRHPDRYGGALGQLNWLAAGAEGSLLSEPARRSRDFDDLVQLFEDAGCLTRQGDRLRFPDEDRRFFVNGGWLEAHVYGLVFGLRAKYPAIQDLARGLRVTHGANVENELDVAFLADNRLCVVECKARRFNAETGFADEPIYKIEALHELLGGSRAKALLVSYQPVRDVDRRRAQGLGVRICAGDELRYLPEQLAALVRA